MRAVTAMAKGHPGIGRAQGPPRHGNIGARTIQYLAAGATAQVATAVDIQMLANAPGFVAPRFGMVTMILAIPICGMTAPALLSDFVAPCSRRFGINVIGR